MKFDWSSCAVGVIAGVGIILCVIFAAELDIFVDTPVCAGDENGLTCARNWANGIAIAAAAGTIFLLAREQSFARRNRTEDRNRDLETIALQTLPLRAKIEAAADLASWIERDRDIIAQGLNLAVRRIDDNPVRQRSIASAIRRVYVRVRDERWDAIEQIDGLLFARRARIIDIIDMAVSDSLRDGKTMDDFAATSRLMEVLDEQTNPLRDDPLSLFVPSAIDVFVDHLRALAAALEEQRMHSYLDDDVRHRKDASGSELI